MTRSPQDGVRRWHPYIWFAVLVVLAVALVSALPAGGARSAKQASGLIAFTRSNGVYVMHLDGSGARRVWYAGSRVGVVDGVSWSPNGEKLAFVTVENGPEGGLYLMNADGSDPVRLGTVSAASPPSWSPDGRRIAFAAFAYKGQNVNGRRDIWIMKPDGSNVRRLAPLERGVFAVDWSPAGGRLAFGSAGWFGDIWVMSTSGRNLHKLAPGGRPDFSPDGRRVAYERDGGIWVVTVSSHLQVWVTGAGGNPAWSPDGRRFAFVRGDWVNGASEIYVMNADGSGARRLTHNRVADGFPAWQPGAAP